MIAQAIEELPNECCGLLAGPIVPDLLEQTVAERFPLVNADASPREYNADWNSLFRAHRAMRDRDLDTLAIYHSHPTTDPIPSRNDLERNYHGSEVVHLIISLKNEAALVRGWSLRSNDFEEAHVSIV
jgi:[CysO sulfur-carrier protein]-S-L-cysteine hydrolase